VTAECQWGGLAFHFMTIETGFTHPARVPAEALWTIGQTGTLAVYDGWTSTPAAQVDVGLPTDPFAPSLLSGGGLLWVHTIGGHLAIVDPAACSVVTRLTVPSASPPGLVATGYALGALWFAEAGRLCRVSGTGERTVTELPDDFGVGMGLAPAVAATSEWLWVGSGDRWHDRGNRLLRVDPATGEITLSARLPGVHIDSLAAAPQGLVATAVNRPDVFVLDPVTGELRWSTQVPDDSMIVTPCPAGDGVWAVGANGTAIRLGDPGTPVAATVAFGDNSTPYYTTAGLGSLWIADEIWSTVIRVDAGTGRILARIPVTTGEPDSPAFFPAAGESAVWVLDYNLADGFSRIDPATNQAVRVRESSGVNSFSAAVAPAPATGPA
jgi:outer membrane protein assembly factor BamB